MNFLQTGQFDLIIFDCDGVLLDSEIITCAVDADAYTALGYPITLQDVARRFSGMQDADIDAIVEQELGAPLPAGFRSDLNKEVLKRYHSELQPIPGAAEMLANLQLPKCVASSAAPAKLALGLVETGLYELVYPHVFSATLVARGKPHPDIFLYAADKMQTAAPRCVVVEDSVAGVTAACAAGMQCIGFTGGAHCFEGHAERLMQAGATGVVNDLAQIIPLVE